jgi:hypothetical protein
MKISFWVVGTEGDVDAIVGSIAVVAASVVEDRKIEVTHK